MLPTRADLANVLFSLKERHASLYGFADHGYSEALYLKDPEGNGIEIYADKDKEEWDIREDGRIVGYTRLLDREKLLEEKTSDKPINLAEGTKVGHIHLSIRDLGEAKDFYTNILGLDNKFELGGQAVFMASGLYHHQVAINSWDRVNMNLREDGDLGLNYFEIIVEDQEDFERINENFKANDIYTQEINTGLLAKDKQNIKLVIKC